MQGGRTSIASNFEARVGTRLANRYDIVRFLGSGGMGAVFEAHDQSTDQRVAVKLLVPERADVEITRRFLREARAATRVLHRNVVRVIETDQDESDGTVFLVQEFLDGEDLRRILDRENRLAVDTALAIVLPIMDGLEAAHREGVVHRDIKPANLFASRNAAGNLVPKLIDFGVAKLAESGDASGVTRTGNAVGTPAYMSPEQARGVKDVDAQSDVWALGVVLFEALAGRCPFERSNANAALAAIIADPIPQLSEAAPDLPRALVDVVQRALERNRVRRYQSVAEFRDALLASRSGISGESLRPPSASIAAERDVTEPPRPSEPAAPTSSQAPSNRTAWMGIALAACTVAGIAGWIAGSRALVTSTAAMRTQSSMVAVSSAAIASARTLERVAAPPIEPAPPALHDPVVIPAIQPLAPRRRARRPGPPVAVVAPTVPTPAPSPSAAPAPRTLVNGAPVLGL